MGFYEDMQIINNIQEINFKGLKNSIIENAEDGKVNIGYFALQLSDDGNKDLSELREVLRHSTERKSSNPNSDILSVIKVTSLADNKHTLFFNGEMMPTEKEMLKLLIQKTNSDKKIDNKFDKHFSSKVHLLLIKVLSRIKNYEKVEQNSDYYNVLSVLRCDIENILKSKRFLSSKVLNEENKQRTICLLNEFLKKTVQKYFN